MSEAREDKRQKNKQIMDAIDAKLGDLSIRQMAAMHGGRLKFGMYINDQLMNTDIAELDLSQRSYNSLKRGGFSTIGGLVEAIYDESDLRKLRNLGETSAKEIMLQLFLYQYSLLEPARQGAYLKRFKELNGFV